MKLQSKQWMLAAILFASINVSAQTIVPLDENAMYFTIDELPDATVWLPAPPDTLSTQFVYDVTQYMWGKTQREDQAIDNVVVDVAEMAEQFSVPFGMEISKEKTPAIFHVLYRGMFTARLAARKPKLAYQRLRPYVRFQEPTLIPEEEESLRNNGSYPSGHSIRGWAFALLLCEINPDAQDAILKLGYEWGQSRVIVGGLCPSAHESPVPGRHGCRPQRICPSQSQEINARLITSVSYCVKSMLTEGIRRLSRLEGYPCLLR